MEPIDSQEFPASTKHSWKNSPLLGGLIFGIVGALLTFTFVIPLYGTALLDPLWNFITKILGIPVTGPYKLLVNGLALLSGLTAHLVRCYVRARSGAPYDNVQFYLSLFGLTAVAANFSYYYTFVDNWANLNDGQAAFNAITSWPSACIVTGIVAGGLTQIVVVMGRKVLNEKEI